MMKQLILGASLAAALNACGGGATNTQSETGTNAQASANMAHGAMPSGPFAAVDTRMHERMTAAIGANASETWTRKMIEHHRGAVEMSQLLIDQGGDPQMVQMARLTVEKQQREIAQMEQMLAGGISGGSGGEANPFGPVEQQMHQAMMAANGASLAETWARKMIVHHQGAVDMSDLLIRQGGNPQVLAMARGIAQDQRREIVHLQGMLRGEAMPAAGAPAAEAPVASAPAARAAVTKEKSRDKAVPAPRQPNPAPKAAPAARPARRDQATPRPAQRPEPAPAPKSTCTPEHAAMGHC